MLVMLTISRHCCFMNRKTLNFAWSLWLRLFPSAGAVRIACLEDFSATHPHSSFSCREKSVSAAWNSVARMLTSAWKGKTLGHRLNEPKLWDHLLILLPWLNLKLPVQEQLS